MLRPLNKKGHTGSTWCVPSAVSMLTGQSVRESHVRAAKLQGFAVGDVEGMWHEEAQLMMFELGYRAVPVDVVGRYAKKTPCGPTLKRFLKERTPQEFATPMYITVDGHALCAHMGYVGDNKTGRPVPMDKFPKLGRLVKSAYMVTEVF